MTIRPMFPLGTVLFPGAVLPLHVFEPRYRELTARCLEGDRRFGITLITRGSEVGGGDQRTDVGTLAEIFQAHEAADGRWALVVVGMARLRVARWLADDPFPQAEIEELDEAASTPGDGELLDEVVAKLRRALALRAELGVRSAPLTIDLDDNPTIAVNQACALAPFGPIDKQALLETPGPGERLRLLDRLLDDELPFLQAQLAQG